MTNKNWYLLQFKQNCHLIAERNLKNQGFETFLPIEKKIQLKTNVYVDDIDKLTQKLNQMKADDINPFD